jgi:hypothetical protein
MTELKTLSTIAILSVAVAKPVFAQPTHHRPALDRYRGVYNQATGPLHATPRTQDGWNVETFGFSGRDPSWVGGRDPSINPSGS